MLVAQPAIDRIRVGDERRIRRIEPEVARGHSECHREPPDGIDDHVDEPLAIDRDPDLGVDRPPGQTLVVGDGAAAAVGAAGLHVDAHGSGDAPATDPPARRRRPRHGSAAHPSRSARDGGWRRSASGRRRPGPARVPRSSSRAMSAGRTSAWWVTSSPDIRIGIPDSKTIAAASGSAQMLNSAAAVVLPAPSEPPISEIAAIRSWSAGAARRSRAMFVSGPVATSVTGLSRVAQHRAHQLDGGEVDRPDRGLRQVRAVESRVPVELDRDPRSRTSGRSAPAATGTSVRPSRVRTRSALRVVRSSGALPATVVIASSRSSGRAVASTIASASSCPGSQSRMIGMLATCRSVSQPSSAARRAIDLTALSDPWLRLPPDARGR